MINVPRPAFFAVAALLSSLTAVLAAPPNVVLIVVDDLGWADIGSNGNSIHETPNLDAFATQGAQFTDAYAASPVCSPTRASLMTGKYPARLGMNYISGTSGPNSDRHMLTPPGSLGNLPPQDITLAEALKQAGYKTAHFGKWHLQRHNEHGEAHYPEANGFDLNIGGTRMGQPGSFHWPYKSEEHPSTNVPDFEDGMEGDYLTDAMTDKAISFIQNNNGQPFFLNLWYYTVHTPIQPRADKLEAYRKKMEAMHITEAEVITEHQSFSQGGHDNPAYAGMVDSMDENIGRILRTLEDMRLDKDTIVIFFSDNGGLSTGSGKRMPACSLPLRAGKAWLYEGGIRVPMIIRYPKKIRPGVRISEPVISNDIYPTILELTGLEKKPQQHQDGVSLAPLMTGQQRTTGREALYFHMPHYHHINSQGPAGAIRMGNYKLVETFETGKLELFDLSRDIGEQTDLADSKPQIAARLKQKLDRWRATLDVAMAKPNPNYQADNDWRNISLSPARKMTKIAPPKPESMPQHPEAELRAQPGPDIGGKPITITCNAIPGGHPNGTLVAQGGKVHGFSVYVRDGKLNFCVRINGVLKNIASSAPVPKAPFAVEAHLAENGAMRLLLNGAELATGNAGGLLAATPVVGVSIGFDSYAAVGTYNKPFTYAGKVTEVAINGKTF